MRDKNIVLIVDDEEVGRETLQGFLYNRGYQLELASNGPEAIAQAKKHQPDVILLDVMMPGMDGFEVCEHIRRDPNLAEVPIIMVTALDDRDSRLRGLAAGADDFVSKPFDRTILRARLKTITELNRYRRLQTERARFEWVVQHAQDAYLTLSEDDTILYCNYQARLYLDWAENDDRHGEFLELIRPIYQCEPADSWGVWPTPSIPSQPRYLVRAETRQYHRLWLEVEVIEMENAVQGQYLVRLSDVTDKMINQRLMWSFHGQVSHKLRTPLGHLSTSLAYLHEMGNELEETDKDDLIELAYKGAQRLQGEINTIFEYMQMIHFSTKETMCELRQLPEIITKIQTLINLQPITYRPPADVPAPGTTLSTSPQALETILMELFENAKKFHPQQEPQITVEAALYRTSIQLKIIDDGITLSPEQLTKIWIPYYQAEKHFSGQIAGMGLGLSMVASIVWDAGGTMRAYNRSNTAGVVFEINLPMS